jgi:hypothetical protein
MRKIELTQGKSTIIDDEAYELVSRYKCYVQWNGRYWYAATRVNGEQIYLHRLLTNAQPNEDVDHRNHDTLDNRRENLRVCTRTENLGNQRIRTHEHKTSRYKGVHFQWNRKKCWVARIYYDSKTYYLGHFMTEEEAALAYNEKARELYGEFAHLNTVPG